MQLAASDSMKLRLARRKPSDSGGPKWRWKKSRRVVNRGSFWSGSVDGRKKRVSYTGRVGLTMGVWKEGRGWSYP